jgi:3-oxoacyl-[acyl-carrier protein] reductase
MDLGLTGRVALVTGAGGLLGGPIACRLADEGAKVVVHHRDDTDRDAAAEVADAIGGLLASAELTDPSDVARLFDRIEGELGPVHTCVANAGRFPRENDAALWEIDVEQWRATIDDNLLVTFITAREWARRAVGRGEGSLVMLSSAAGLYGQPGHGDYATAKAGIAFGLLGTLKNELGRAGGSLRANVVAPAWTAPRGEARGVDPDVVAGNVATQALPRLGRPEDVAAAVAWLASPVAAAHVTGEVVRVTGGMEGRVVHPPGRHEVEGGAG